MTLSLCAAATYQWQYSVIGELDGDVLTMRGAVFPSGGLIANGWMLDTTGAVQVDDVTWFAGDWNATALRADSCVLSAENAGAVGFSVRERNGEIWATSGRAFTASEDALLRRRPDGTWSTVIAIPEATTFWVNSETDIWLPHHETVTHFDGQMSTTELLPAPSDSRSHRNAGIWVTPGGQVWVTLVFTVRDHVLSQVLRRTASGWETVLSVDDGFLRVFGGAGEAIWVLGDGAIRRWDGSTLTLEDTGSTARWADGFEREDGSTVLVGEKGAIAVRSPAGQWRAIAVKTSVSFTSVTRAATGRLILGTSAFCDKADDVCPTIPPTTEDPAATPPTLGASCRLPGTTSPGCGCGAGPSVSATWLIVVLARLLTRRCAETAPV